MPDGSIVALIKVGSNNYTLAKFSAQKALLWEKTINDIYNYNSRGSSIALDANGNILLVGLYDEYFQTYGQTSIKVIKLNQNGDSLTHHLHYTNRFFYEEVEHIEATADGGYLLVGSRAVYEDTLTWNYLGQIGWLLRLTRQAI